MQNSRRNGNQKSNSRTKLKPLFGIIFGLCLTSCATIQDRPMTRAEYLEASRNFNEAAYMFNSLSMGYNNPPAQPQQPVQQFIIQRPRPYQIQTPPNGW